MKEYRYRTFNSYSIYYKFTLIIVLRKRLAQTIVQKIWYNEQVNSPVKSL